MNVYKVRPLLLASMRPPEFTGGNGVVKTTVGTINFGASMRPPEFTGGNHERLVARCELLEALQ